MKIVVLAGGLSNERDVSLTSSTLIANALIENGHSVAFIDLYKGIDKFDNKIFQTKLFEKYVVDNCEPNLKKLIEENNNRTDLIGPNVIKACQKSDLVFIGLHGGIGENGKLQALFDIYNIKYTGADSLASSIAMDKNLAKNLLEFNKILTPKGIILTKKDLIENINLEYPLVVKPNMNGSSIGVFIVNNIDELKDAVSKAFIYDDKLIIEQFIKGREFSVGIIGNQVLPAIEIIPKSGFYDYKNKYQEGLTIENCPADITDEQELLLRNTALDAYNALKLNNYARIDFILDKNNNAYCLEANTLPGMTPTSLLPQEANVVSINYHQLCEKIIEEALKKY